MANNKNNSTIFDINTLEPLIAKLVADKTISSKAPVTIDSLNTYRKAEWGYIKGDIYAQQDLAAILKDLQKQIDECGTGGGNTFHYKGQVDTEILLPADANIGDMYNVKDVGANYVWNGKTWDKISQDIDLSGYITKEEFEEAKKLYYLKKEIDDIINTLNVNIQISLANKLDVTTYNTDKQEQLGNITLLQNKLDEMESKINDTKHSNTDVLVLYEGHDSSFENKEKDYIINGVIKSNVDFMGNSVTIDNVDVNAASANIIVADECCIKNTNVSGLLPQKISDYVFNICADKYVTVKDCNFTMENCYNNIEVGYNLGLAKYIIIENVNFNGLTANNAINVYGMANNGVLTISNCHFENVANVLKISNRALTNFTINLINCTCDKWTDRTPYNGLIHLEDYTSLDTETANKNNMFKKLIINIQNCKGPNGIIKSVNDLSTICGSQDDNQLIYMYDEYRKFSTYNVDTWPTINIF